MLVVTKLDRLATVENLEKRKVGLRVLEFGLDTSTAKGQLILNVLGSVVQFERSMMLERQRDGIAKARSEGKYRGRAPTAMWQTARIKETVAQATSKKFMLPR